MKRSKRIAATVAVIAAAVALAWSGASAAQQRQISSATIRASQFGAAAGAIDATPVNTPPSRVYVAVVGAGVNLGAGPGTVVSAQNQPRVVASYSVRN